LSQIKLRAGRKRQFRVSRWTVLAYGLVIAGAALRVAVPHPRATQALSTQNMMVTDRENRSESHTQLGVRENGAGEGIRTLDPHVGNVMLYP
jgi:hypothetical protein